MNEAIKSLLNRRKNRMIATILGAKEDYCDDFVPLDNAEQLRKVILDQINDYCELCTDLLKSIDSDSVIVNEEFLDTLYQIKDAVTNGTIH